MSTEDTHNRGPGGRLLSPVSLNGAAGMSARFFVREKLILFSLRLAFLGGWLLAVRADVVGLGELPEIYPLVSGVGDHKTRVAQHFHASGVLLKGCSATRAPERHV